ncbi:MAG: SCP2 sterol-binding domain-containing protein [Marinobacter sp.]|uniref:ubiquinone anaerobic biosynthesis accessory factor UbiT n=1 Tax=Marinobacter sp. TaxID=50741 RepID=UPI00299EA3B2|nr:SCP2 sterol-binding domain-containing protein [Marinobacter sp.]MDX1755394.1 SCP2 sterol-binding domain-containing protein [Marinobacter sp.]
MTPAAPTRFPRLPSLPRWSPPELLTQALTVARDYRPSPTPLLTAIDRALPFPCRQLLVEVPLNRLFAEAMTLGEFDEFEGRRLRLELDGGAGGLTLGFWCGRLRLVEGPGEATIRGSLAAFKALAERSVDPDQLFFQRRLVIEGETELGLAIKNLLDSLDWSPSPFRP